VAIAAVLRAGKSLLVILSLKKARQLGRASIHVAGVRIGTRNSDRRRRDGFDGTGSVN
jgi:hypothetical protein